MPTNWKRIPVTEDPQLAEALQAVSPFYPEVPAARLVHDLAILGARAIVAEQTVAGDQLEALVAFSTRREGLIDWAALERVDELAWSE